MKDQVAIQRILQSRLTSARAKNPSYSVRAFSKKVGVSAGTLSLIMLGKRTISRKLAEKITKNLMLDPQERAEILKLFPSSKREISTGKPPSPFDLNYLRLTADQFRLVAEWQYFAILNLTATRGFKSYAEWIATRIKQPAASVTDALARLKRLGMLRETPEGNLERVRPHYSTTDDVANESLRKSHHQSLELARESLEADSVLIRDFTWLTLPIDLRKLPLAKTLIRKFQDEFMEAMRDGVSDPDEVYRLAVQLFPLTRQGAQTVGGGKPAIVQEAS
jgi:uncharacterized protein (TIGR02147 family)